MSESSNRQQSCVNYLQEKGFSDRKLFEAANAVNKVAGEVDCMKNGEFWRSKFSDKLYRCLNESLMVMCCDPDCDSRDIRYLKTLIEDYRDLHEMPEIEITVPENQVVAPSLQQELDNDYDTDYCDQVNDECDIEEEILAQVSIGDHIALQDLVDDMAECKEDELCILDGLKALVRKGYLEVVSREPYNGTIDTCLRIK